MAAVLGGMIGGGVFRDPFSGPVFGVFIGLLIALLIVGIVTVLAEGPYRFLSGGFIVGLAIVVAFALPLTVMKVMFDPPVWVLTRKVIAHPTPASVSDIRKHIEYDGPENRYLLRFNVSPGDVEKIVNLHGMVDVRTNPALLRTYQDEPRDPPAWWTVGELRDPEAYRLTVDVYQRVLIYDESSETAYMLIFPAQPIAVP